MATPAPDLKPTDGRDVDENRDPGTGRFLPGYKGGRKHRIDLLSVCDRRAREEGMELEDLLWQVFKGLVVQAAKGDTVAARIIFERVCTTPDQLAARLELEVTAALGPPTPVAPGEVADYFEELASVSRKLRNAPRITVTPEAESVVDELLS